MVDWYGVWTYEPNTPEEKKCYADLVAEHFLAKGFEPKTTIENCVLMAMSLCADESGGLGTVENCIEEIEVSGGLREYDWWDN